MNDIIAMHRADLVNAVTEAVQPLKARIDQLEGELNQAVDERAALAAELERERAGGTPCFMGRQSDRIRALEAAGNDLRASVVAAYPIELPASAAERIRRFDALFASQAETPVRQVHSKSEYKRLTALGVECVVTEAETKP